MANNIKLEQTKWKVDSMIGLPSVMLRKGTVRTGDPIMGFVDYNYKLLRDEDGRFIFYTEWVDTDGEGNRVAMPHGVVVAMIRAYESLMAQARKNRAVKGAETRKANEGSKKEGA